jgi:flotillin
MVSLIIAAAVVVFVLLATSILVTTFLRSVDAGEILLASRGRNLRIYRGPCKALIIPVITQYRAIPSQAINVDIDITDQTSDIDPSGRPAPVKVTVRASAIVSVGEDDAMVSTAANKFFSKPSGEQLSTLADVLSSAGRRAINLLKHDQLFNARPVVVTTEQPRAGRGEDDELAVIIKDARSRELLDLGLTFNSLNIKAVLSEVADARRRESAARAKADADVVTAREEQRARIAQLEAAQKVNDQERALNTQIAANAGQVARAEAEKQAAVRQQREAELNATQITQAQADAEQNVIAQEAEGRAQATRIRAVAEAEADAIRMKAKALVEAGEAYLDLRRLELAPSLTREIASALANGQFVNFGRGGESAAAAGSDDVLRVVETLLAAKVITGNGIGREARPGGGERRRSKFRAAGAKVMKRQRSRAGAATAAVLFGIAALLAPGTAHAESEVTCQEVCALVAVDECARFAEACVAAQASNCAPAVFNVCLAARVGAEVCAAGCPPATP